MGNSCAVEAFYSFTIDTIPLHYCSDFWLFFQMESSVITFYFT